MRKRLGTMVGDVVRSVFKKPATQLYPFERKPAPIAFRGKLVWEPEKCAGCMLCVKDCPANAIELIVLDKVNKRFVMRYHADRCIYCAQCAVSCRFNCLDLSDEEWELASTGKEPFTVYYGKEEDIAFLLEKMARDNAGESPSCGEE